MKTVYIVGAGFSVEAGAPTQLNILPQAMRLQSNSPALYDTVKFDRFKSFLTEQLGYSEDQIESVDLEDIFTPLDRCLTDNTQFRGIGLTDIMDVREAVFYVVGRTIQLVLEDTTSEDKAYITKFARYLVNQSSERIGHNYSTYDPVSVISTNWDILLDNSIYKTIREYGHDAVVDYCCYISSTKKDDDSIKPGLEKLGQGGFNVKLLKLHGSLNWLQCPRCMRLYARLFHKDAIPRYGQHTSCRHCDGNFPEETGNHTLASNLIMPTFIKDLSNPQYKIIWQNAGIEISEAEKIVFIGYSLPNADFEMRQLLSRMTRQSAQIEVVDFSNNEPQKETIRQHWKKFFGKRDISFNFSGASNYIESLLVGNS